jgi:hypothetical protein
VPAISFKQFSGQRNSRSPPGNFQGLPAVTNGSTFRRFSRKSAAGKSFLKESHCFIRIKSRRPSHFVRKVAKERGQLFDGPDSLPAGREKLLRDLRAAAFPPITRS